MFGFFKKKFDPLSDLSFEYFDGARKLDEPPAEGLCRVVTRGLEGDEYEMEAPDDEE